MASTEADVVAVNIFEREFKIKCPKDKVMELQQAAKYLNEKMQEVSHGDEFITIDRVAITAALNIAHELILAKHSSLNPVSNSDMLGEQLLRLNEKVDQALANAS